MILFNNKNILFSVKMEFATINIDHVFDLPESLTQFSSADFTRILVIFTSLYVSVHLIYWYFGVSFMKRENYINLAFMVVYSVLWWAWHETYGGCCAIVTLAGGFELVSLIYEAFERYVLPIRADQEENGNSFRNISVLTQNLHHAITVTACILMAYTFQYQKPMAFLSAEAFCVIQSNIFLYLRQIKPGVLADALFFAMFSYFRMYRYTLHVQLKFWDYVDYAQMPNVLLICYAFVSLQSGLHIYWFYLMLRKLAKRLYGKKGKKD